MTDAAPDGWLGPVESTRRPERTVPIRREQILEEAGSSQETAEPREALGRGRALVLGILLTLLFDGVLTAVGPLAGEAELVLAGLKLGIFVLLGVFLWRGHPAARWTSVAGMALVAYLSVAGIWGGIVQDESRVAVLLVMPAVFSAVSCILLLQSRSVADFLDEQRARHAG